VIHEVHLEADTTGFIEPEPEEEELSDPDVRNPENAGQLPDAIELAGNYVAITYL
jgi:hypothetical protein